MLEISVDKITMKPTEMDPSKPTVLKSYTRPADPKNIVHDQMRVDQIFKHNSMQRRIGCSAAGPRQKNKFMMTAAQEIGWYADPLVPKNEMQSQGSKKTEISAFASEYVKCKKKNPFSREVFMNRD